MRSLLQDLRYGARILLRAPGFTTVAVLVLALGIGANTAVFTLVNALLFRPLNNGDTQPVVGLSSRDTARPDRYRGFSYPNYLDVRERSGLFTELAALDFSMVGLSENGVTRRVFVALVSSNYFSALGVGAARGRAFSREEERPGRAGHVAIVSYEYLAPHRVRCRHPRAHAAPERPPVRDRRRHARGVQRDDGDRHARDLAAAGRARRCDERRVQRGAAPAARRSEQPRVDGHRPVAAGHHGGARDGAAGRALDPARAGIPGGKPRSGSRAALPFAAQPGHAPAGRLGRSRRLDTAARHVGRRAGHSVHESRQHAACAGFDAAKGVRRPPRDRRLARARDPAAADRGPVAIRSWRHRRPRAGVLGDEAAGRVARADHAAAPDVRSAARRPGPGRHRRLRGGEHDPGVPGSGVAALAPGPGARSEGAGPSGSRAPRMAGACLSTTRARCRTGGPVARPAHGRGAVPARSTAGGRLRPGVPPRPRPRPRARSHARRIRPGKNRDGVPGRARARAIARRGRVGESGLDRAVRRVHRHARCRGGGCRAGRASRPSGRALHRRRRRLLRGAGTAGAAGTRVHAGGRKRVGAACAPS